MKKKDCYNGRHAATSYGEVTIWKVDGLTGRWCVEYNLEGKPLAFLTHKEEYYYINDEEDYAKHEALIAELEADIKFNISELYCMYETFDKIPEFN